jgi:hypothetical protein
MAFPPLLSAVATQIPMGLCSRYQIVPRLYIRYLHRYNHVNIQGLVEQNFHGLPGSAGLRCHPLCRCKVVVRRLYHLLLPPGTYTYPSYRLTTSYAIQLAYEARKAKKIIASRDISFAFTNVMAQNYYSLRMSQHPPDNLLSLTGRSGSYDHFCFFCHINDSTKKKDDFAFFIFFTFKGNCSHSW